MFDGLDPFAGDPLDPDHLRPDPLRLTFWPRLALGALLICSAFAVWWVVCAVVEGIRFVKGSW